MTNKEAIEWLEAIDKKYIHGGDEFYDEQRHKAIKTAIKALDEERPKGKWIEHEDERWGGVWYTCSNCNQNATYEQDTYNIWRQKLSNFCPNCGSDNRGDV